MKLKIIYKAKMTIIKEEGLAMRAQFENLQESVSFISG